jgi:hypothetical protein
MATFSTQRYQQLADALSEARGRLAVAMASPKKSEKLNAARAEVTRLPQEANAVFDQRADGSGCAHNPRGYKDLLGHGETGVDNPVYAGPEGCEPGTHGAHGYQETEAHYPQTISHHPHQARDDGKPGGWFGRKRLGWMD